MQEARLSTAQGELEKAQKELDAKESELAVVREKFDNAMKEKQVDCELTSSKLFLHSIPLNTLHFSLIGVHRS